MRSNMKYILAIDAGGTFFKSCIIGQNGEMVGDEVKKVPVDSDGGSEIILNAYREIISGALIFAKSHDMVLAGIGISTPGPFDYVGFKSLMKHKFAGIYGINLRDEIIRRCFLPAGPDNFDIKFIHDAHAFILGEYWKGAARGYSHIAGVTIGTGTGFGCMSGGKIKANENGGPYVSIYSLPCRDGILEDYVSGKGIVNIYRKLSGECGNGRDAKEIGRLAESGKDKYAVAAYREAGEILAIAIKEILTDLEIECLVLGGQISRSFALMEEAIAGNLAGVKTLKKVCMAQNIDFSPLFGAALAVSGNQT